MDKAMMLPKVKSDLSSLRSSVRSDALHQILCSKPILPNTYGFTKTSNGQISDLFQEAKPSFTYDNLMSILEPYPIDEDNMTILKGGANNSKAVDFLRTQQQQMENLLRTVLLPESAVSSAVDAFTKNPASPKRGLVEGFFQPAKKQRQMSMSSPQKNTLFPIVENAITQSGRFRNHQSSQWSARFQDLQEFHRQKGHCCVPHGCPEYPVLARWVKRQRYQYKLRNDDKASTMTVERIAALEDIGFVWNSHGVAWMERFNELQEYFLKYKSCNVSSIYSNYHGNRLSSWVKCQKRQYKMFKEGKPSRLDPERVAKLESLIMKEECLWE